MDKEALWIGISSNLKNASKGETERCKAARLRKRGAKNCAEEISKFMC